MTDAKPLPHDPYIDAVIDALNEAGLTPTQWWTSVSDEYNDDDELIPSAVLTWSATHPAIDADEFDHGIGVYWNTDYGWQCARQQPNGANDYPDFLDVQPWAAPEHVVTAVRGFLALVEDTAAPAGQWERADEIADAIEAWRAQN